MTEALQVKDLQPILKPWVKLTPADVPHPAVSKRQRWAAAGQSQKVLLRSPRQQPSSYTYYIRLQCRLLDNTGDIAKAFTRRKWPSMMTAVCDCQGLLKAARSDESDRLQASPSLKTINDSARSRLVQPLLARVDSSPSPRLFQTTTDTARPDCLPSQI